MSLSQGPNNTARPAAFISLFLAAAAFLKYEILLMRLLSLEGWSHYAYMVVSLSMLGAGFSGVLLGIFPGFFRKNRENIILCGGFLFAAALPLTFHLNRAMPLNYLYAVWDRSQFLWAAAAYVLYGIPFIVISLTLAVFFLAVPEETGRVYSVNLTGSGFGILAGIITMHLAPPEKYVLVCALSGALSSLAWGLGGSGRLRKRLSVLSFAAIAAAAYISSPPSITPYISEYKGFSHLDRLPGVETAGRYFSPMGVLSVQEGDLIRLVSGQSLTYRGRLPRQSALTFDGDSPAPIFDPREVSNDYFSSLIFSLPYSLSQRPDTLIIGAGGLGGAILAQSLGSGSVRVIEINPQVIRALESHMPGFREWKAAPGIDIVIADARAYAETSERRYDIIQMDPTGTFSASAAGLYAMNEDYLNTVESFGLLMGRLSDGGILMVSRWVSTPARAGIKTFASAVEALESRGVENPGAHLVMIRNWDIVTLLAKNTPFTDEELDAVRAFSGGKYFDISFMPQMDSSDANRFHVMPSPIYHLAALEILDPVRREAFYRDYIFNVRPATDDRPYFSHYFRWSALPHLIDSAGSDWLRITEFGYLVQTATFLQALTAGLLLIIVPMALFLRKQPGSARAFRPGTWLYFAALGAGFMILEIGLIQRFILFLHNPVYSAAIVIGTFLVFSGIGSLVSQRLPEKTGYLPFLFIVAIAVAYAYFLGPLFAAFTGAGFYLRLLLSVAVIAPLAFFLGMPFPMAMRQVVQTGEANTGAAWGINGFFSVIGAVTAPLLAMHAGFRTVILTGAALYIAALITRRLKD